VIVQPEATTNGNKDKGLEGGVNVTITPSSSPVVKKSTPRGD
jgi:hypothetical protein